MLKTAAGFFAQGHKYATWNPADKSVNITLTNGNLTATAGGTGGSVRSTLGKSSGKWYFEIYQSGGQNPVGIGNSSASLAHYAGYDVNGYGYLAGLLYHAGTTSYGGATSASHWWGIALDMDNKTLTFIYNNISQGIAATGLTGTWFAMPGSAAGLPWIANFGASPFAYTVPAGYNSGLYL
jgi:hypothetical protein